MACGCPVLASDIPVLREVCADAATYFNPLDTDDIRKTIIQQLSADDSAINAQRERGFRNIGRFSWKRSASVIMKIVERSLIISRHRHNK
jgi:glycosyltransferase involved in cell wall biosynthesis